MKRKIFCGNPKFYFGVEFFGFNQGMIRKKPKKVRFNRIGRHDADETKLWFLHPFCVSNFFLRLFFCAYLSTHLLWGDPRCLEAFCTCICSKSKTGLLVNPDKLIL